MCACTYIYTYVHVHSAYQKTLQGQPKPTLWARLEGYLRALTRERERETPQRANAQCTFDIRLLYTFQATLLKDKERNTMKPQPVMVSSPSHAPRLRLSTRTHSHETFTIIIIIIIIVVVVVVVVVVASPAL